MSVCFFSSFFFLGSGLANFPVPVPPVRVAVPVPAVRFLAGSNFQFPGRFLASLSDLMCPSASADL